MSNKFFAIYDLEDNFITTCEDYKELSIFFKKPIRSMHCCICRFKKGKIDSIINNRDNKRYKVYEYKKEEAVNMKIKPMKYETERKTELLYTNKYNGFKYYVMSMGTHPTAYIEIPKRDILYRLGYKDIDNIYVHGGFTYEKDYLTGVNHKGWFIGWDYAHAGDYMGYFEDFKKYLKNYVSGYSYESYKKWTTEEIIEECKDVIDQIIENYPNEKE